MANPIQYAQDTLTRTHQRVQPYMADLFNQIARNYLLLLGAVVLIDMIVLPLILRVVPLQPSTANIIGFSLMLVVLFHGWRFLENRNHATALFVLYIRYSRQKRDLESTITLAEEGALEDENTLYVHVDILEENATMLLQAVEEQGLKAFES